MSGIHNLPIGKKSPDVFNAVIEISRGSHNKYEYDEELGVLKLDRVLYSPVHYPLDYGFIPETRSEDGDHLDAMVIGGDPVFPGCLVEVRPLGFLKMIDAGEEDFKILGVQKQNPRFENLKDIKDVESWNPHFLKEVVHFFEVYKNLQNKEVKIMGWGNAEEAKEEIRKAQAAYAGEKK